MTGRRLLLKNRAGGRRTGRAAARLVAAAAPGVEAGHRADPSPAGLRRTACAASPPAAAAPPPGDAVASRPRFLARRAGRSTAVAAMGLRLRLPTAGRSSARRRPVCSYTLHPFRRRRPDLAAQRDFYSAAFWTSADRWVLSFPDMNDHITSASN